MSRNRVGDLTQAGLTEAQRRRDLSILFDCGGQFGVCGNQFRRASLDVRFKLCLMATDLLALRFRLGDVRVERDETVMRQGNAADR